MTGRAARRKGIGAERELVRLLKQHHIPARRVANSGAADDNKGDLIVNLAEDGTERRIEVKRRREFRTLYRWLGDNWALLLRGDNEEWLIVTRLKEWL